MKRQSLLSLLSLLSLESLVPAYNSPMEENPQEKLLWLLEEVRARRIGYGKAAELAEIPLAQFLTLMSQHRISPFNYEDEELEREFVQGN